MVLYRICSREFLPQDPTGAARTFDGRWHKIGQRILYFSSSLSLCVLEMKANAVSFERIRDNQHYCALNVDSEKHGESVPDSFYSRGWAREKQVSQEFGGGWYNRRTSLLLAVRSVVLPVEWNYLINTAHPDFATIVFPAPLSIPLDSRLL